MSGNPLVSIIVPCYNAGPWLAQALESCLAQTWTAREIIVVNDGSRDDSLAVARSFETRGVVTVDQPNRGASAARNAGLGLAKGDFIQYLDADDVLAPEKIARQMSILEARPDASLVSGEWARFAYNSADAEFIPHANWKDITATEFLQLYFEAGMMMHPAAWLSRRSLLDESGPWNETLSLNDDGEYFARVLVRASRIAFCPGARSYYRSNLDASLSGRKDAKSLDSLFRSFDLILGYLASIDDSPRTLGAIAFGWKWLAFEVYPGRPDLSAKAEGRARALGWSDRPFPGGGRFQLASRILGWRMAKRLCS
jgi:glycosyltransferase involved in cell wall biosynthesis